MSETLRSSPIKKVGRTSVPTKLVQMTGDAEIIVYMGKMLYEVVGNVGDNNIWFILFNLELFESPNKSSYTYMTGTFIYCSL